MRHLDQKRKPTTIFEEQRFAILCPGIKFNSVLTRGKKGEKVNEKANNMVWYVKNWKFATAATIGYHYCQKGLLFYSRKKLQRYVNILYFYSL